MVTKQELNFDSEDINQYIQNVDVADLPISLSDLESNMNLSGISIAPGSFPGLNLSPSELQDDITLDIADRDVFTTHLIHQPVLHYGRPEKGAFKGEYNFELQVLATDTHKRKYLYSNKLNRIYVDIGRNFTIHFSWDFPNAAPPMFVRATPVFSSDDQVEKRVERCISHLHLSDDTGVPASVINHVLHSTRELGTTGVTYCGDPRRKDSWYSVLVEFGRQPDAGSLTHSHAYQFVCKNSCSTGINRRAIDIVFTLEDITGKVCGRQWVGARVCACPRRDMLKDEEVEDAPVGKRKLSGNQQRCSAKKVKVKDDDDDDRVFTIPAGMTIVGSRTLTTGLTVMLNMMEQMVKYKTSNAEKESLQAAITSIKTYKDQI